MKHMPYNMGSRIKIPRVNIPAFQADLSEMLPAGGVMILAIISILFLALFGCVSGGGKPVIVQQYALDYPTPAFSGLSRLDNVIMVDHFSIAQAYNSKAMVYRTTPFKYSDDAYNRWRVNPADMVTDCLLRDLRNTGLFKAVFPYGDVEDAGYIIEGSIEEFIESETHGKSQAVLSLNVSLLNTTEAESAKIVVFQKTYRVVQPVEGVDTESFVQAMSRAMERVSKQIITDAYEVIRQTAQSSK